MISDQIRARCSYDRIQELEKQMIEYEKRYYSRLVCKKERPKRTLGYHGIWFLLNSLQRSRCLFIEFIDCINRTNILLAYLGVRSHFESTGSVAYFLQWLRRLYQGKAKHEEVEVLLGKLLLGGKTFPSQNTHPYRPDAINVLTQIEAADKLFGEMKGQNEKMFRDCYDFLSEFCHPNFLGTHVGVSANVEHGTIVYNKKPEFIEKELQDLIGYILISCIFFFQVYDESFSILKTNEEMPDLELQ